MTGSRWSPAEVSEAPQRNRIDHIAPFSLLQMQRQAPRFLTGAQPRPLLPGVRGSGAGAPPGITVKKGSLLAFLGQEKRDTRSGSSPLGARGRGWERRLLPCRRPAQRRAGKLENYGLLPFHSPPLCHPILNSEMACKKLCAQSRKFAYGYAYGLWKAEYVVKGPASIFIKLLQTGEMI